MLAMGLIRRDIDLWPTMSLRRRDLKSSTADAVIADCDAFGLPNFRVDTAAGELVFGG